MARSGGRSEWERQQAALRREAERQARERARLAKEYEKALRQQHLESQQRTAEEKTAAVDWQIKILDEVLTSVLPLSPLSFERLKVTPKVAAFDPAALGTAQPVPDWGEYAPTEPGGLSRMFGGAARHERRTAEARARFEEAMSGHSEREAQRQQALTAAKAEHERRATEVRAKAAAHNADIEARMAAFATGERSRLEFPFPPGTYEPDSAVSPGRRTWASTRASPPHSPGSSQRRGRSR